MLIIYSFFVKNFIHLNMKHLLTLTCTLLLIGLMPIVAQNKTITWGLEAGINYSNSTEETDPLDKKCPILPRVGLTIEYELTNHIYLQSGLIYSMKGIKSEGGGNMGGLAVQNASVKLTQHVLQIPFYATYKQQIADNLKLGAGVGPYFAYGVGGKTKAKGMVNENPIDLESNTFGDNKILKRFDAGLNFKVNAELYKHYTLGLSYELGLTNIGNATIMGGEMDYENRILSLTLGYMF
ncbi:hypothetical protein M2451_002941 [Dysgonomonas sp. PFB1-18]|nr:hypothetical protein [Dysgonomonas sp. PF1-14]MDH6339960.1 hypothetical protein [Dysgonomonas sp. PF1-16]MDH6381608.1 hypothetical protein [Dysgonomonas sp. PFB1-18]MDH6398755.1 hypothetical protein [Dysgonomonas sp. PF1-23]